jgi:hypothetical protein
MSDLQQKTVGGVIKTFKAHPGFLLSIAYFSWAVIGIIYLIVFYANFNIPILKTLEISDVLLAGLQEPRVSLALFSALVLVTFIYYSTLWSEKFKNKRPHLFTGKRRYFFNLIFYVPKNIVLFRLTLIISLIAYFMIFLELFIAEEVKRIKTSQSNFVQAWQNGEPIKPQCWSGNGNQWKLLGTTTRFIYLYHLTCDETIMVTVENVELITLESTQDKKEASKSDD